MRGIRRRRHRCWRWMSRRAVLLMAVVLFVVTAMAFRCRPVVTTFAESQALWLATKVANQTVAHILEQQADTCRSIVRMTYNDRQVLSSLTADTVAVNTVKTAVTAAIIERMEAISTVDVGIPLGTLLGLDWLSGWGPVIPFSMSVTGTVLSSVATSLEAAGMNQTNFRVLVNVQICLYLVTPGGRTSVSTDLSYPMAETVLLGEVPDNLTEVYGDDQNTIGEIFDYGTVND